MAWSTEIYGSVAKRREPRKPKELDSFLQKSEVMDRGSSAFDILHYKPQVSETQILTLEQYVW